MPPLVAAIGAFVEPDIEGLWYVFREAWNRAPVIAEAYANGIDFTRNTPDRHNIIRGMAARKDAVRAFGDDEDQLTELELAFTEPAFNVGLALGLYLMTQGGVR